MSENAFITIVNGLKLLKKHPVLFVPGIAYYTIAIFLAFLFGFFIIADLKMNLGISTFSLLSILFFLLMILLSSFTTAGSIGMAKEVLETGYTDSRHLFSYGKKFTLRLIWASFFIMMLRMVSAFFWTPVLNIIGSSEYGTEYVINALKTDPTLLLPMVDALAAPVFIAILASSLYLLLVSFMFYFVSYIIVIDNMKVFKSYRTSFKLLRKRPIRVSSFVFLITIIEMLITFISVLVMAALNYLGISFYSNFFIHLIISLFLTAAMNIWVTRFYMILTEKSCAPMNG
ncbi:DUF7847 domain-containing protein [Methanimicrococcus blatticola]|uniref:DUF7847 domain-containing protein n=1 Tax=Methanimicrococcus blatticola TaxID=91560 RepID=A0A484F7L4_9EURY|nr:hypothetical protein [Methanimicrococcus blatticola]MBZ3934961.1 hypothetical protein [Methanimicrococcus blatticola]MCC2508940.1 hypothetical protein [Methanimicrococcus blatticola]TDQ71031.1 hypothetical protein C7391_0130 [Methanimicrococcus blatticola]